MSGITTGVKGQIFAHEIVDISTGKVTKVKDIGGFKQDPNSVNKTEGAISARSFGAQYLFSYPHDTPQEDMYNPQVKLRVAEVGSVPEDISGSGREVVYIKGTASPGASQFDHDFVLKVYLNSDGTTSVGIGETGAELHENGDVTGSIWGEDGLKAYIDSRGV